MAKTPKRPRDPNQHAKRTVDIATGVIEELPAGPESREAETGRMGGVRGGRARAERMSPEQRSEAAKKAAAARWRKQA